ncbi:MAG: hypothetical protein H5T63_10670 [Chloroflexi bacterium]|nr:hypothetical protein [Chloroflexota bacterium]
MSADQSPGAYRGVDCATANTHDSHFRPLIEQVQEQMTVLGDGGFSKDGDPPSSSPKGGPPGDGLPASTIGFHRGYLQSAR